MTGLALGGNKARKLEYLLGAAQAEGATVVMTTVGAASDDLRMTAAVARKAGMRPILFMRGTGNSADPGQFIAQPHCGRRDALYLRHRLPVARSAHHHGCRRRRVGTAGGACLCHGY